MGYTNSFDSIRIFFMISISPLQWFIENNMKFDIRLKCAWGKNSSYNIYIHSIICRFDGNKGLIGILSIDENIS